MMWSRFYNPEPYIASKFDGKQVDSYVPTKEVRINCECGDNLLNHRRETCAPSHRDRVLNLIKLVENDPKIRKAITVGSDINLCVDPRCTNEPIPYCIWLKELRRGRLSSDTFCIHCAQIVEYMGPLRDRKVKIGKFRGYCCDRCYDLIQNRAKGQLCVQSIQMPMICKARRKAEKMALGLCLLRLMYTKDVRKLLMSYYFKTQTPCEC